MAGAAQAARVLRPRGRLALFWNAFLPSLEVAEAFTAAYDHALPGSPLDWRRLTGPDAYAQVTGPAAEGIRTSGAFEEPEEWRFGWERSYARDEWLDQVPTFGGHNRLPAQELDSLLTGLGAAIDAMGGSFTMRCTAVVVTALRTG